MEFLPKVRRKKSFLDRAAVSYVLNPLNLNDTTRMIEYRLERAGFPENSGKLFTEKGYEAVFKYSKGKPRRICKICKKAIMDLVLQGREKELISHGHYRKSLWLRRWYNVLKKEDPDNRLLALLRDRDSKNGQEKRNGFS